LSGTCSCLTARPTCCCCCLDIVVVADSATRLLQQPDLVELSLFEKKLQQLEQRQATATFKSVEATMPALHVVIRAHATTTDADVGGTCPRRVRQTRAVDVVEE